MGAPTKRGEQLVLAYFTRNSSELADPWAEGVQQLLEWLSANPNAKVTLEGFASSEGLASRNLALSEQRAVAMKQYLMSRGAAAERIQTSGAGTSNPLASNATADGRAKNRRVEVRF
jgi:outer membrane protein OmpA-like peptidoglycan-associated protein